MVLSIQSNIASLNAQRNLANANSALANSIPRLSTNLRIGMAREPVVPTPQSPSATAVASRNAQQATSYANVTEAGLSETANVLYRMRELAVSASNDVFSAEDRNALNEEFSHLKAGAVRVGSFTEYSGEKVFEVDSNASTHVTFGTAQFDKRQVALIGSGNAEDGILTRSYEGTSFTSDAFNISATSSVEQRQNVLKALDSMISDVTTARLAVGTFVNEVQESALPPSPSDDPGTYTPTSPVVPDRDYSAEIESRKNAMQEQMKAAILAQANLSQLVLQGLRV